MSYAQANLSERMESIFPTALDLNETLPSNGHVAVARDLFRRIGAADGRVVTYGNELRVYLPQWGVWEPIPKNALKAQFRRYDGCSYLTPTGKKRRLSASVGWVNGTTKSAMRDVVGEDFFDRAPKGVQFANGFLRLRNGKAELFPTAPENRALWGLRYDYDDGAECPNWMAFLREVLTGSFTESGAKILVLQRFLGACVFAQATTYQKCLILRTERNAGTDAILDIVTKALFDERVVTGIDPKDWAREFELAKLSRSAMNVVHRVPELPLTYPFQSVITGVGLSARFPYRPVFRFSPRAGHIFVCKRVPRKNDMEKAYSRRLLPMTVNEQFGEQWSRAHYENFVGEIVSSEAPGIMAWAVRGAEQVRKSMSYGPFADAIDRWWQC